MFLKFKITLQEDKEIQSNATARSVVVRKLELWVPSLHFKPAGQKLVNETFLKPISWTYLNESLNVGARTKGRQGCLEDHSQYAWDETRLYLYPADPQEERPHPRTPTSLTPSTLTETTQPNLPPAGLIMVGNSTRTLTTTRTTCSAFLTTQ